MNMEDVITRRAVLGDGLKWGVVTLSVFLLMAFSRAADLEAEDADVLRAAAVNPYERKLADGLLKLGPAVMQKEYEGRSEEIQSRLDAWLSRGSLDTKLAASMSPKTLLGHLEKSGIHHNASVAATYGMLCDFSHVYRDQLRLQNERDFRGQAPWHARFAMLLMPQTGSHFDVRRTILPRRYNLGTLRVAAPSGQA